MQQLRNEWSCAEGESSSWVKEDFTREIYYCITEKVDHGYFHRIFLPHCQLYAFPHWNASTKPNQVCSRSSSVVSQPWTNMDSYFEYLQVRSTRKFLQNMKACYTFINELCKCLELTQFLPNKMINILTKFETYVIHFGTMKIKCSSLQYFGSIKDRC